MSAYFHANDITTSLTSGITSSATSITVDDPAAPFKAFPAPPSGRLAVATLADNPFVPSKKEIITYTGVTDNGNGTHTLTGVTRGREGTAGQAFSAGDACYMSPTVASLPGRVISDHQAAQVVNMDGATTISGLQWGYLGSKSAFGGDLTAAMNAASGRSVLGLGTAATADVQTSPTDTTAGRLMAVGAFGVGGAIGLTNANDYDSVSNVSQVIGNTTGSNVPGNTPVASGMSGFQAMSSADRGAQILIRSQGAPAGGNRAWIRGKQEAWAGWSELWHTGNLPDPATLSGDQTFNGRVRADQFVVDAVTALGNITGSTTINLGTSNILSGTLTGNATLSFTAPPGPCTVQILLTNSGAGNTITLPGSVTFVSGAQTEDDGAKYVLSLIFDGTNYWASWAT